MNVSLHTRAARLLPIGIFVLLALLVLGVWGFLRAQERVLTTGAVAVAADQTARYVRDYLAVRQMAVSQLAVFWDSGRPLRGADFVDAATRIEAQFPGIQSINLVDRQGVIIQVAPLSGNRKAIGLNINSYPAGRTALAAARATGRWVATPPIDLVQGGRGFVALLAIGGGADHAAFLQIVIRLDQLAHQIWQMSDSGRIGLAIDDQSVPVLRLDPGAADGVPVERDVAVADRTWTIRLVPAPPPMLRVAHAVPVIVGLLVAALVAWLVEQAIRRNVALRASEKRFRDYAEAASDWFWELDPAGQLTYLSASFESVLGKSVTPFVGQPIECLMHALDVRMLDGRPMQSEDLPRTRGGTSIQRIHAADGESIMLLIRWHAVRGPDGRVVGCRGAGTDLRRETAAYERAILAEHRLHHAIQSISQGFALFDDQERLVLCNDRYLSFLPETVHSRLVTGISHEEIAELLAEAGLFDGVDRRLEEWQALFRSGDRSIEFQARGGPWLQISYGGTDEGGRVIVVTDISDLKQREAVIRNSEERYRSLVDGSIQGMLVHRAGRLLFANHTAAEMLGFQTAAQAVECGDLLPFRSRRVPERIGLGPDPLLAELATGEVRDFEIEATRRDGMPLWLVVRASRVDWNGEPAMQMTLFDGTSHKQIERSLLAAKEMAERASRAKSTFLAQMSYELRTPLNAVIGFSEILQQEILGPLGNARYREYADDIAASGRHLLAVINDILDVAKFEAGRLSLQESRISLGEIIQSSLRMLHERAEAADILLDSAVPAGLPPILGDHSKIKQILINLLSNALKFTPGGGQVTVAAEYESDGAVAISVRDTGVGMAADEIPRALEPFTQVGGSAEIQQQGTGLGLPLAKAFTLLHGGALTIESAPGRGTCVTFRLPRERVLWEAAA